MDVPDYNLGFEPEEFKQALIDNDVPLAAKLVHDRINQLDNAPLNIAITGNSGSGKSTFVNAIRGLSNTMKGSAPTGMVETTKEATPYAYPKYPNVQLWDLPGIGTPNFQPEKYLEQVGFNKYDFFIIISCQRFTCNDKNLAREIQRMGKKFYFVRSQIDSTLDNEKKAKGNFNEEAALKNIRDDCIKALTQLDPHQGEKLEPPKVFLISSLELRKYDFPSLQNTLELDLPEHKRHVLQMAIPNISLEVIQKKKKYLHSQITYHAALSAAMALVPIPGLSFSVDLANLVTAIRSYCSSLGVDLYTLENLSQKTGVDKEELIKELSFPFNDCTEVDIALVMNLLLLSPTVFAMTTAEEGSRFVPFVGSGIAGSLSFIATYKMLNMTLDMLAEGAQRVMVKSLKLSSAVEKSL